jgi:flagellar protein FlgJ
VITPLRPPQATTSLVTRNATTSLPLQSPATSVAAPGPTTEAQRNALRGAAQQFEAVFLRQMIGSMRQAHLADDPFGSQATEQFREMSDASLADSMSHQGVFGIAQMLLAQFDRHVAAPAAPAAPSANANPEGAAQ